jgi:hypothetical protein
MIVQPEALVQLNAGVEILVVGPDPRYTDARQEYQPIKAGLWTWLSSLKSTIGRGGVEGNLIFVTEPTSSLPVLCHVSDQGAHVFDIGTSRDADRRHVSDKG